MSPGERRGESILEDVVESVSGVPRAEGPGEAPEVEEQPGLEEVLECGCRAAVCWVSSWGPEGPGPRLMLGALSSLALCREAQSWRRFLLGWAPAQLLLTFLPALGFAAVCLQLP